MGGGGILKALICGDRAWNRPLDIERVINHLQAAAGKHLTIISGGCRGADAIAEIYARRMGIHTDILPPDWDRFGTAAGPIRNRAMLDKKPDVVIAFHQFIPNSKGTKDCVDEAERRGIKAFVIKKGLQGDYDAFVKWLLDNVVPVNGVVLSEA